MFRNTGSLLTGTSFQYSTGSTMGSLSIEASWNLSLRSSFAAANFCTGSLVSAPNMASPFPSILACSLYCLLHSMRSPNFMLRTTFFLLNAAGR